jgi:hypothetical protein
MDVKERLQKILTPEQRKKLRELSRRGPGDPRRGGPVRPPDGDRRRGPGQPPPGGPGRAPDRDERPDRPDRPGRPPRPDDDGGARAAAAGARLLAA